MKFWSDDFDMDLLKVYPDAPKMLRNPERSLWTVGHTSFGRLNHPVTWNSHGAFLWMNKPNLPRDKDGWLNVGGCVSSAPEVECTWLEWLRDAWTHNYGAVILPLRKMLPGMDYGAFERIMYDLRGWRKQDVSEAREAGLRWIMRCDSILNSCSGVLPETDPLTDRQSLREAGANASSLQAVPVSGRRP